MCSTAGAGLRLDPAAGAVGSVAIINVCVFSGGMVLLVVGGATKRPSTTVLRGA